MILDKKTLRIIHKYHDEVVRSYWINKTHEDTHFPEILSVSEDLLSYRITAICCQGESLNYSVFKEEIEDWRKLVE